MTGRARLPFTGRATLLAMQSDCSDLRRTHAHLVQGTRPSKKDTKSKDVKRYLLTATIAKDGLLVVKRNEPLAPSHHCSSPGTTWIAHIIAYTAQSSILSSTKNYGSSLFLCPRHGLSCTACYK